MHSCPNCKRQYKGQPYFCSYCGYPLYDLSNQETKDGDDDDVQIIEGDEEESEVQNPEESIVSETPIEQHTLANDNVEQNNSEEALERHSLTSTSHSEDFVVVGSEDDVETVVQEEDVHHKHFNMVADDIDDENDEKATHSQNTDNNEDNEKHPFNWLALVLFLLIFGAIGYGVYWYFNVFAKEGEHKRTEIENSRLQEKEKRSNQRKHTLDSIENARITKRNEEFEQSRQMDSLYQEMNSKTRVADSINRAKRYLEYAKDSLEIQQVLAIKETKQSVYCYYIDKEERLFNLRSIDIRHGSNEELVGKMEARLVKSFESPDHQQLIVLCKDDTHKYGMAFKVNMSTSELTSYHSQDNDGNKCYDVGINEKGFYMSFGKQFNDKFKSMYKIYYDKFGNIIEKK